MVKQMGQFKQLETALQEGMDRGEILDMAKALTYGDRNRKAGDFVTNHENIASIWSVILGIDVQAFQVALCMAGVKLARTAASQDLDHFIDGAAYFAGAGECATRQENPCN
jgi:hypothetical protein